VGNEWVTVLLNSIDLIGWDPAFALADWLVSKTWCGHLVQLSFLCATTVSLVMTNVVDITHSSYLKNYVNIMFWPSLFNNFFKTTVLLVKEHSSGLSVKESSLWPWFGYGAEDVFRIDSWAD